MACLEVDHRERGLIRVLSEKGAPHCVSSLAVGDVLCIYDDRPCGWVLERKRADDFAASLVDGRWREQTSRLLATGHQVLFCIEGDLRFIDGMYAPMLAALTSANLRVSSRCFRTMDVEETANLVVHLAKKLQTYQPVAVVSSGLRAPQTKRQRACEADIVFARQLMCIPSVSERIATCLVQHFGNLEALQDALRDASNFPRVRIGKTCLGKARIAKLERHLLRVGAA